MVSFSCESCGDVLTKKKLDQHRNNQCRGTQFSCLDCMVTFPGTEYRAHTSCISEAQKYEKTVWKGDKKNNKKLQQQQQQPSEPPTPSTVSQALVTTNVFQFQIPESDNRVAIVDAPPAAPSPPPMVNVFDFLIENGGQSRRSLGAESEWEDEGDMQPDYGNGYSYGAEPVRPSNTRFDSSLRPPPQQDYATPAPQKGHSRNISTESTTKKGSKRKRAHVDDLDLSQARRFPPNGDVIMTDVPPVMHSGLTGGLNRLLSRPEFPPSPDYSGGDGGGEASPGSPLKRSKSGAKDKSRSKDKKTASGAVTSTETREKERSHKRTRREGESSTTLKPGHAQWVQIRRHSSNGKSTSSARKRSESPTATTTPRSLKAIEYRKDTTDGNDNNALIIHSGREKMRISSRAELFMSFIASKGASAEEGGGKGCSINKALKRYHRERGERVSKLSEEKELWKVLRLRVNDRGEIVLFPGVVER